MKTQESIYTQHEENSEWISKLKFYTDEISIIKNRLEDLVSKNNKAEVLSQVERFQNQMIIQKNNIDEITHVVKLNEEALQTEIKNNPIAIDQRKSEYHNKEKEAVESFEKNFNEIRGEFKTFAAKWM